MTDAVAEDQSEAPGEVTWAMDICDTPNHPYYGNPTAAHQIVREEDGGKVRITACGQRLTESNHRRGWWSTRLGKLPLPADAVHCMAAEVREAYEQPQPPVGE
jgi:hypothetical protein